MSNSQTEKELTNKNTNRNIRVSNNLEKLLLANEFGYAIEAKDR